MVERRIDLTGDEFEIASSLLPLITGARIVSLYSPGNNEWGYVVHDDEPFPIPLDMTADDILVVCTRVHPLQTDLSFAAHIARRFMDKVEANACR